MKEIKEIILPEDDSKENWYFKFLWKMRLGYAPQPFQIIHDFCQWCYELIFPRIGDNWAWKIRYWLNPRQKWIKKYIEYYSFSDKAQLVPDFLFGCIIDLVESEKYFQRVSGGEKFDRELRDCYNYITVRRKNLEDEIEKLYDTLPPRTVKEGFNFTKKQNNEEWRKIADPIYEKIEWAEKKLDVADKDAMIWIVSNCGGLWT